MSPTDRDVAAMLAREEVSEESIVAAAMGAEGAREAA